MSLSASELREQIFSLLYSERKPEQAILKLNRIIKETPERSDAIALKAYALNKFANSLHEWKYSENALEQAEKALALNPDDDIALISKGWALIDTGRAQVAIPALERATKVNPKNEYAWYNLAWAQYLTGDSAASTESIKKALQSSPRNLVIKHGKEMMDKGAIPSHLKKTPKGL